MRTSIRVAGELVTTLGLLVLLFVGYLVWGTGMQTSRHQRAFADELARDWHAPRPAAVVGPGRRRAERPAVSPGRPFAVIRIPRFGSDYRFVISEGTALTQLARGPGHEPGTALPGRIGNFVVAGHRVTFGNPFLRLPELRFGDPVLIDTRAHTFTYRVTGSRLVSPYDISVLAPVPGRPGHRPRQRWITLITCDPPWSATHRYVVFGVLDGHGPRAEATEKVR